MKIIIIDDEQLILKLYKILLQNMVGVSSIILFSVASEAIEYLTTTSDYDLVITDYSMPPEDLTGLDVAKAAKAPVILISGSTEIDNLTVFDNYLKKPFYSKNLISLVQQYIDEQT